MRTVLRLQKLIGVSKKVARKRIKDSRRRIKNIVKNGVDKYVEEKCGGV